MADAAPPAPTMATRAKLQVHLVKPLGSVRSANQFRNVSSRCVSFGASESAGVWSETVASILAPPGATFADGANFKAADVGNGSKTAAGWALTTRADELTAPATLADVSAQRGPEGFVEDVKRALSGVRGIMPVLALAAARRGRLNF